MSGLDNLLQFIEYFVQNSLFFLEAARSQHKSYLILVKEHVRDPIFL